MLPRPFERTWVRHAQTPRMLPPDGIPHGKTVPPTLRPRRNAPPALKFKILMNDGMDVPKSVSSRMATGMIAGAG